MSCGAADQHMSDLWCTATRAGAHPRCSPLPRAATAHALPPPTPSTCIAATIRGLEQQQAELEQRAADVREREMAAAAAAAALLAHPPPNRPSTAAPPCTRVPLSRPGA